MGGMLLSRSANVNKACPSGSAPCHVAAAQGHEDVIQELRDAGADFSTVGSWEKSATWYLSQSISGMSKIAGPPFGCKCAGGTVTPLISMMTAHPGAGSVLIDGAFDDGFLDQLSSLWHQLPQAIPQKASPTKRAYFSDLE